MEKQPLFLQRTLQGFIPADPASEALIRRYTIGENFKVNIFHPRNPQHHKIYWVMLNKICENLDKPTRPETLHALIKIRTGHVETIKTTEGIIELPGSIAFDKMKQAEFKEFFDAAVNFITSDIIPGLNRNDLIHTLQDILGGNGQ